MLQFLNFDWMGIDHENVNEFSINLTKLSMLEKLSLSHNALGDQGLTVPVACLPRVPNLQGVRLVDTGSAEYTREG